MTEKELERLRPPHVTMGGMRLWRVARLSFFVPLLGIPLGVLLGVMRAPSWCTELNVALSIGGFALAFFFWLGVVAFGFARYSLQTLMLGVLLTATIAALTVALPDVWKTLPILAAVVWIAILFLTVADHDPERRARFYGYPKKPPEDDGSERVP